jgi:hypothetical protein
VSAFEVDGAPQAGSLAAVIHLRSLTPLLLFLKSVGTNCGQSDPEAFGICGCNLNCYGAHRRCIATPNPDLLGGEHQRQAQRQADLADAEDVMAAIAPSGSTVISDLGIGGRRLGSS